MIESPKNSRRSFDTNLSDLFTKERCVIALLKYDKFLGLYPKRSIIKRIKSNSSLERLDVKNKIRLSNVAYPLNFFTITDVLCPPNPNVFDKATFTVLY